MDLDDKDGVPAVLLLSDAIRFKSFMGYFDPVPTHAGESTEKSCHFCSRPPHTLGYTLNSEWLPLGK